MRAKISVEPEINRMTYVIHELKKENHCEKQMKVYWLCEFS